MDKIIALQNLINNVKEAENCTDDTLLLDFSTLCRICLSECTELCDLYQSVTFDDHQVIQEEIQLKDIIDTFIDNKVNLHPYNDQFIFISLSFRSFRTMICHSTCAYSVPNLPGSCIHSNRCASKAMKPCDCTLKRSDCQKKKLLNTWS